MSRALHGEIVQGATPLFGWSAEPFGEAEGGGKPFSPIFYQFICEIVRYSDGKRVTFPLRHNTDDGVVALSAAVLKEGCRFLDQLQVDV